jgi:hypothetical protein
VDPAEHDRNRVAGLCADCEHSRRVESSHQSTFYLCQLSATDPAFPKYPPIPVIRCRGYARVSDNDGHG